MVLNLNDPFPIARFAKEINDLAERIATVSIEDAKKNNAGHEWVAEDARGAVQDFRSYLSEHIKEKGFGEPMPKRY